MRPSRRYGIWPTHDVFKEILVSVKKTIPTVALGKSVKVIYPVDAAASRQAHLSYMSANGAEAAALDFVDALAAPKVLRLFLRVQYQDVQ